MPQKRPKYYSKETSPEDTDAEICGVFGSILTAN